MKNGRFFVLFFFGLTLAIADDPFFAQRVQPILTANCLPCHDAKNHASGFAITNLDSITSGGSRRGTAVIPGDPAASPLVRILKGQLTPQMPLGKTLADADLAIIETWIRNTKPTAPNSGAAWLWPYRKPAPQEVPKVSLAGWTENPIDAFILQKLEQKKLSPAPPANKRTLARRLYFDLLGMPPTVEEMNAFLQDESPQAWAKLVDHLLDDPRYGERWGRHWLDLVRAKPAASKAMDPSALPGAIAIGSSTPSTATCPTISSSLSSLPAPMSTARPAIIIPPTSKATCPLAFCASHPGTAPTWSPTTSAKII